MGVLILYLFANLLLLAFFLDAILEPVFPNAPVIASFKSLLLYYFLVDLLLRLQFQELPTLRVRPYLILPMRRKQIVNYLSMTSLWSGFNFAPFVLTLPFVFKVLVPTEGITAASALVVSISGLTLFNNFFSLWLKRKIEMNGWLMLALLATVSSLALLDFYWRLISISSFSAKIFQALTENPVLCLVPVLAAALMHAANSRFLFKNLYLDELRDARPAYKTSTDIPLLGRFGAAGELAAIEIKLILRNKRPRSTAIRCLIFLLYGLIFYPQAAEHSPGLILAIGMLMTGIFILHYGQFMFGWQASHFDGFLAMKLRADDFIRSKFILFSIFSLAAFVLTLPYAYFGWRFVGMQLAMFLWNLGVNTVLVLFFANRNYRRIDLSKSASFNWEGVGATQWLLSIPLMLSPMLIYFIVILFAGPNAATTALALVGTAFILSRRFWIKLLEKDFNTQRYKIAEGFRNE